jgi:hypothetical protein
MPYNVISTTYIAKFKINSNTKIEVFYKDKEFVSVSEVYKVQYNSNGIIRQLIGNNIKYYHYDEDDDKNDDKNDDEDDDKNDDENDDNDDDDDDDDNHFNTLGKKNISFDVLKDGIIVDINDEHDNDEDDDDDEDDEDDKLINMPSSFVICKENLKTSLLDCEEKWKALSYEKRVEFYATYKAELNIKT